MSPAPNQTSPRHIPYYRHFPFSDYPTRPPLSTISFLHLIIASSCNSVHHQMQIWRLLPSGYPFYNHSHILCSTTLFPTQRKVWKGLRHNMLPTSYFLLHITGDSYFNSGWSPNLLPILCVNLPACLRWLCYQERIFMSLRILCMAWSIKGTFSFTPLASEIAYFLLLFLKEDRKKVLIK